MHYLVLVSLLSACVGGATATLSFDNQTVGVSEPHLLADGTSLRLKLIAAYLAEEVDPATMNNVGNTAMVWLNDQCADDISGCNVSGEPLPAGPRVTDYFDFARPTDEVNAQLNSQGRSVPPGSYRYARLELCKSYDPSTLPSDPTLMWRAPGMTDEVPFTSGDCGRTSLPFEPALELADGDTVEVTLGYDLASAIIAGPNVQQCDGAHCYRACVEISGGRACMDFPDFAPSARKGAGSATATTRE